MIFPMVAALIAASFSLILGIFAFSQNHRGEANKNFALLNISLAIWNIGEISSHISNHLVALYIYRLSYIGASFVPYYSPLFLWSVGKCRSIRREKFLMWTAIAFAVISPTSLIIKDISMITKYTVEIV